MNKSIFWISLITIVLLIAAILTIIFVGVDVLTVFSNLFLLIPAVTAYYLNRRLRSIIYVFMCIFSALYHLCDSYELCLFSFEFHHNLDFFFAEFLIILGGLYLVEFTMKTQWIEYWLIFTGALIIVILQNLLPGELSVQAGITAVVFFGVIIYWIVYKYENGHIPKYNWSYLTLGLALTAGSITLFSVQNMWYQGYWGIHSLWNTAAAIGQHYILMSRKKAPLIQAAAGRINYNF